MMSTGSMFSDKRSKGIPSRKRKEPTRDTPSCELKHLISFGNELTCQNAPDGRKKLENGRRIDGRVTLLCSTILKTLMTHSSGWVFDHPVDPVALNIPDYFVIISNPMDLGTIKSKLDKNMYYGTEEFAADVRLTFSNAMLFNPVDSSVHRMAAELSNLFERRWKPLMVKCNRGSSNVGQGKLSSGSAKQTNVTREDTHEEPPLLNNLSAKRPKVEKSKRSFDGRDVKPANKAQDCRKTSSRKVFSKGTDGGSRHACGSVNAKPPLCSNTRECGGCGSISCKCSLPCGSTPTFSRGTVDAPRQDCRGKRTSATHLSKLDPDTDGAVATLDDKKECLSSQPPTVPSTDAAPQGGQNPLVVDLDLSPEKALRVALLKSRFKEIIVKAQPKTLLDQGDRADPLKMQQQIEKMERRQCEEIAKIKALIEKQSPLKQREREREAARGALQKMNKTVDFVDNLWAQREFEMLVGAPLSYKGQWRSRFV